MKLKKRIAAMSASTSWGVNWKVYRMANTPSGTGVPTDTKTVGGLTTTNDSAIDFQCGGFTGGNTGTYALCDIDPNLKKTVRNM